MLAELRLVSLISRANFDPVEAGAGTEGTEGVAGATGDVSGAGSGAGAGAS